MSESIFMLPDVGEGLVEAEIVAWKVAVGDVVTLNQPLVDIETAKATVELPSPYAGTVTALHGAVGDVMAVGAPLVVIETDAASPSSAPTATPETPASVGAGRTPVLVGYGVAEDDAPVTRRRRRTTEPVASPPVTPSPVAGEPSTRPARSTPPVRLYAKQHGVNLATVTGTGRDGLITRDDVERALAGAIAPAPSRAPTASASTSTTRFVGREIESWSTGPLEERIPVRGVLRSMADAMVQSAFQAPHAAVWVRVEATGTVTLLESLRERPAFAGVRLSPLTIVALAVCDAARHFPGLNSSYDAAAQEVVVRRRVNLGIAANTPRGLIVPNIKGADTLDLRAMAVSLNELVEVARAGTTTPETMLHTTLSITNVGPFAVDGAVPILPPGTGAIIAVGQIAKRPWVVGDDVVARPTVDLSMAFDHRQIDGALASAAIAHIGRFISDPAAAIIGG
ncbi:MAG: dihydrolipoamide acetyltransferase family protein [Acidimicrobiales bacterium]